MYTNLPMETAQAHQHNLALSAEAIKAGVTTPA